MEAALGLATARKGGVKPFGFELAVELRLLETGEGLIAVGRELFFELVDELAKLGTVGWSAVFELEHKGLYRSLFAEIFCFEIL